ncbi:hypothetical protein [Corynebacterium halotolerans]|uniref:hypothetical protein n=1 Tax=Corynebacterium halotolerans TaxID=225326 RepID=UPI003CF2300A
MKSSFIRTSVVTGLTAISALAVAACSPALENPSDEKVDTATGFAAPSGTAAASTTGASSTATTTAAGGTAVAEAGAPSFIDCVAAPAQTPDTVSLDCTNNSDALVEIEWQEWGAEEATGTGTRETMDTAGETTSEDNVEIVLASPFAGPQGLVFTEITVDGEIVTP